MTTGNRNERWHYQVLVTNVMSKNWRQYLVTCTALVSFHNEWINCLKQTREREREREKSCSANYLQQRGAACPFSFFDLERKQIPSWGPRAANPSHLPGRRQRSCQPELSSWLGAPVSLARPSLWPRAPGGSSPLSRVTCNYPCGIAKTRQQTVIKGLIKKRRSNKQSVLRGRSLWTF